MSWIPSYKKPGDDDELKIVTWSDGTDEQIVAMVQAHYDGLLDLHDYWAVGDERVVSLSAMSATGVGESHVAQDITMVLMHVGGKELVEPIGDITECAFIVGQKKSFANGTSYETGYMNSTATNQGSWDGCARRTWCNNVYYNAIPATLRSIFKQHKNLTDGTDSSSWFINPVISNDYFALPAEREVFGRNQYARSSVEESLVWFEYYKTSSNRIKWDGEGDGQWWERSPCQGYYDRFCAVIGSGANPDYNSARYSKIIAPFGVI